MTYIGEWASLKTSNYRPPDLKAFLEKVINEDARTKESVWQAVAADSGHVCVYVFHCNSCNRFRATWDMD